MSTPPDIKSNLLDVVGSKSKHEQRILGRPPILRKTRRDYNRETFDYFTIQV